MDLWNNGLDNLGAQNLTLRVGGTLVGTQQIRILRLQQPKNFSVRLSVICDSRIWVTSNTSNLFNMTDWILHSELSHSPSLEFKLDATTGRAIAMRRGAGRIRRIATPTLWLERLVINGDIKMTRAGGDDNCTDLGTKHLDYRTMNTHLKF